LCDDGTVSTSAQGEAPVVAPPPRRRGCLRALVITAAALTVLALVVITAVTVVMKVSANRTTSGEAIQRRPEAAVGETTSTTSLPPGIDEVEPVAENAMLVSVARNPPVNPCGDSGPDFDIEVMGIDGQDRRPISEDPTLEDAINTSEEELWARLSPDRRRMVFYRSPTGKTGETCRYSMQELWIANVDGTGVRRIFSNEQKLELAAELGWPTEGTLQGHADWAPDGKHVVMVLGHAPSLGPLPLLNQGETELFVMDVDTGDLRQVTERRDAQGRGVSSDPSWTPDGSTIIFVGCPDSTPSCDDMQILSVPADAERATRTSVVFDGPGRNGNDVYVSPDGTSVSWMEVSLLETRLYVSKFRLGHEIQPSDTVLVDAHGGYANWSADSERLIYSRLWLGDRFALFSNSFDGEPSTRVSPPGSDEVFYTPSP
jgi:hypothetical protein